MRYAPARMETDFLKPKAMSKPNKPIYQTKAQDVSCSFPVSNVYCVISALRKKFLKSKQTFEKRTQNIFRAVLTDTN